jgi:AraC-like DNA-binding protein
MIFIPLPFVETLFLLTLLLQMHRRSEGGLREHPLFALLLAAYALQSVLIGLRWGYQLWAVLPFQGLLATIIATLAFLSFQDLASETPIFRKKTTGLHGLPAVSVVLLLLFWPEPVGAVIILVFLGYGTALVRLCLAGTDGLVSSRLDGVVRSYRSLQITAAAVLLSAIADIVISLDFAWSDGSHAGEVVAAGNVLALLALGAAASVASTGASGQDGDATEPAMAPATGPTPEEIAVTAAAVDALMDRKALYKDTELNLGRLARRLNCPARSVSIAVNRVHGMSVSQYVNNFRIAEACRLLAQTDEPVTRIMFDAGFLSKSNFNREFLRVTGTSPTLWRSKNHAALMA